MYIRTKDGRILDFDKLNEVSKLSIDMAEEPIREAKTIEELCDEFVLADDEFKHVDLVSDYNDVKQMLSYDLFGQSCYGAIWTKDGLKFVAKRNCFGELEQI